MQALHVRPEDESVNFFYIWPGLDSLGLPSPTSLGIDLPSVDPLRLVACKQIPLVVLVVSTASIANYRTCWEFSFLMGTLILYSLQMR